MINVSFVFNLRPARFWLPVRRPQLMPISWTMTPIIHLICALPLLFLFIVDALLRSAHCLVPATVPHTKASSAGSHRYAYKGERLMPKPRVKHTKLFVMLGKCCCFFFFFLKNRKMPKKIWICFSNNFLYLTL